MNVFVRALLLCSIFCFTDVVEAAQKENTAKVLAPSSKLFYARIGTKLVTQIKERESLVPEGAALFNYAVDSSEIELPGGHVLTLGANTSLVLNRIHQDAPVIITLSQGLLRYRQSANRVGYYPSLILTRNGSVGVRGDDIIVVASKNQKLTSVLSLVGEANFVAIGSEKLNSDSFTTGLSFLDIQRDQSNNLEITSIKRKLTTIDERAAFALSSDQAVVLAPGQFSSNIPALGFVSKPAAINPLQYKILLVNRQMILKESVKDLKIVDPNIYDDKVISVWPTIPDSGPEGESRLASKIFRPKSGGLFDLASGLYSSPSRDATFDNTGKIYLPGSLFRLDGESGQIIAPKGLVPSVEYGFQAKLSA